VELLVVNELFMSATAKFADYVLACRHPFERTDVPRLMDNYFPFPYMQYSEAMVEAPAGVFQEFEIFWELARQLGIDLDIPGISMKKMPTADEMLDGLRRQGIQGGAYTAEHDWLPRQAHAAGAP
jgi:anaerobic selenocysteine-containing dehydrogenase